MKSNGKEEYLCHFQRTAQAFEGWQSEGGREETFSPHLSQCPSRMWFIMSHLQQEERSENNVGNSSG